jgi:NAD(P)-dependent dehydrogenase (short-subunit alcohol dehydrogenase family)
MDSPPSSSSQAAALQGRLALITGASRGIGRAAALAFAKAGAHTILLARTVGALEELDDEICALGLIKPTLIPLDLLRYETIDQLGAALYQRFGRLDILLGNAAMLGTLSPLPHIAPKEWQQVFDLNVTANFHLVRALDPLLKQSQAGRVVMVSSGAAHGLRAYWGAYAASKAALEQMTLVYAAECQITPIKVNIFDPGRTRTAMRAAAYPGEDPSQLPPPESLMPRLLALVRQDCPHHGERIRV